MALLSWSFSTSRYFQQLLRSIRPVAVMARSLSTMASTGTDKVLPFSDIPGPKGTIQNILGYACSGETHLEVVRKRFQRFGPIYSEQVLDTKFVNIADVDAIAKVLKSENITFPMRPGFDSFADATGNEILGSGLPCNDYDTWYAERSIMSPKLMRPKEINETYPLLNTVADDFVKRLNFLTQSDMKVNNIERELSFWAIESFASVFFKQRLGFYNHPPDPTAVALVDTNEDMMRNIAKLLYLFPFNKYVRLPAHYRVKKNIATMNAIGKNIVKKLFAEMQEQESSGKESLFEYLARNGRDTPESLASISGLITAGIDTTTTTCVWLLYLLSRHPEKQEKLYRKIISAIDRDKEILASNIPLYLKETLKESQRIYPAAGHILSRVFDEDLEVLGYQIPSGVNIVLHQHMMSLDERYYGKNAQKFLPERWLRDEKGKKKQEINPFASLPFGFGIRMCIGRRMAESMIYTLVSKILCTYRLEYADEFDNEMNWSMVETVVLKPDRPVLLKFIPRQ